MKTSDEEPETYEFGWWPELAGVVMTLALIAFFFWGATGSL
ncbi:hypothetical protein [Jiella pacifica]|nr:hypothetical protein [Jiella pacifica]